MSAPATAADPPADPVVLTAGERFVPRATQILNAGSSGFLPTQKGDDRLRWIDYATGSAEVLAQRLPQKIRYDIDTAAWRTARTWVT